MCHGFRCHGPSFDRSQIRHESDECRTATVTGQDSPLLLTKFPLEIHKLFQYDCYSQVFNKNACAASVLTTFGPGVTYATSATPEQIKAGLRLRAHAEYTFSRIWDRSNLGIPHRKHPLSQRQVSINVNGHTQSTVNKARMAECEM